MKMFSQTFIIKTPLHKYTFVRNYVEFACRIKICEPVLTRSAGSQKQRTICVLRLQNVQLAAQTGFR